MMKAVEVRGRPDFRIWVRFEDGTAGEIDLSHLAGRGVFEIWDEPSVFAAVHLGSGGSIAWSEDVEICADSVYLTLTGKQPEDLFPSLRPAGVDA